MSVRRVVLLALALPLLSCGNASAPFVPDGAYAGSNAAAQEVVLQVHGGEVKLNSKTLKRDAKTGAYVEKKRKWSISCAKEKGSKDIRCELTMGGHTETVELMHL